MNLRERRKGGEDGGGEDGGGRGRRKGREDGRERDSIEVYATANALLAYCRSFSRATLGVRGRLRTYIPSLF